MIGWTRCVWSEIHQETGAGVYPNVAGFAEENSKLTELAYRSNHDQMVTLKRRYDLTNLFRTSTSSRSGSAGQS